MIAKPIFLSFITLLSVVWNCQAVEDVPDLRSSDYFVFLSPSQSDNLFWGKTAAFAEKVARDLGVNLESVYGDNNRFTLMKLGLDILRRPNPPRALIVGYFFTVSERLLREAGEKGVYTLMINTRVPDRDRPWIGQPRTKFKNWVGHLYPDDVHVGHLVAKELLRQATIRWPDRSRFEMLAISGAKDSMAALDRNAGLHTFLSQNSDRVALKQTFYTKWRREDVVSRLPDFLERYPALDLIWSASDHMALGAREVVNDRETLIAGVDWSDAGLQAVKSGALTHSVGGHFVEGGWAVVLLYDYFNGVDFANYLGLNIKTRLTVANASTVNEVIHKVSELTWEDHDFSHYSLYLHPENQGYNFYKFLDVR